MFRTHLSRALLLVSVTSTATLGLLPTAVATMATASPGAPAAPAASVTSTPTAGVTRVAAGYDVSVNGVRRATVPVSDPAYAVRATASADGATVAAITDFDGTHGATLLSIDAAGRSGVVATGAISSAAFSPNGTLAYVDGANVVVGKQVAGKLDGRAPALLGWTGDGSALLTVQHPDVATDATYLSTLGRFDPATGTVRPLLVSSTDTDVFYRDLRLVRIGGVQRISFIQGSDIYRCGGGTSAFGLADEQGTVLTLFGRTSDNYRSAIWSQDGRSIAYELMGCVAKTDKSADPGAALRRINDVAGVYVRDVATASTRKVMQGLSYNYPLAGFDGASVSIGSAYAGTRAMSATASLGAMPSADSLDAAMAPRSTATSAARKNPATYIHQLWDTRDDFNGNSSCGPTSAVIDLVGYQLTSQFSVTVSAPYSHTSPWGRYITDQYTAYGTTFSAAMGDYNRNGSWKGAHGWITGYFCGPSHPCAGWSYETDYLQRNSASVTTGLYDANWVRARINEGKFVIMSGTWGATQGHLSVVVGYTDDGRFYVHDTYGAGTDGSYDGAYAVYTWGYIAPANMWAA